MKTKSISLLALAPAFAMLAGCGPSHTESLATDVTKAIVANDMRPVEPDFNAIVRPKLENRAYVGKLSDELNALGSLKSVKEDTPSGAPAGEHRFEAEFDKQTWVEDMTLDSDGKIAAFHVHPPVSTAPSS